MNQQEYLFQMTQGHVPSVDQSLGILQSMNPVVDQLIPSDYFDPVENMQPYGLSPALGSVQDLVSVLQVTDFLFRE
jgi:hypothetical protein